jgi:peptide/nickel transport system substrate-binding protein
MHLPLNARVARVLMASLLVGAWLVPTSVATAADPVVLTVGTTQDLDSTNPFNTELVVGYEVFLLTYNPLVDFGDDLKPIPGFAESWERAPDRVTFHIRQGMKWSDGQPATSADACYSWGLALAAIKADDSVGAGFLDPNVKDAGVTKVDCPDDNTMVAFTTDQSDRVFQVYVPILPKHIFGKVNYKEMADEKFNAPLVGTGPYILKEWKTNQFARFERNPNYWGKQGFEDEVVIRFFKTGDSMAQALKAGEIDYAHDVNPQQLKQLKTDPTYTTVVGAANGWTQLAFNTYGTGTGKTIPAGGPSTKALLDTAFRDAIGYAVDKKALVDRVLGGFGDVGTTVVPPALPDWHVEPDNPRHFDIELAKQKLDAAGYKLDANGNRLDKEGKPISLRLYYPDSDENYTKSAQFVSEWYGQLGIKVTAQQFTSAALGQLILPPPDDKAKYDIELWGWAGNPDPNALLQIFRCDAIGGTSDSQYCNPDFDKLYDEQLKESGEQRKATLAKIQNLIYDEAPYDVLYYDANLDAYRNDRFGGWVNMPANGTPLFTYGTLNYTQLTDAKAAPSAGPSAPAAPGGSGAAASAGSSSPSTTSSSGSSTPLIIALIAIVVVVVAGALFWNRRRAAGDEE